MFTEAHVICQFSIRSFTEDKLFLTRSSSPFYRASDGSSSYVPLTESSGDADAYSLKQK
jgi:hypothetical protein